VRVARASLRDFRNYERVEVELAEALTVVAGPNGAGKTNLLEAIYFGCTGRSPRTSNEREVVRRGTAAARVEVEVAGETPHLLEVGFEPGEPKRLRLDGAPVERFTPAERPLLGVFIPERLELVKGGPSGRRAHLDQLVAALWPARAETRGGYSRALAQRNALLLRVRAGASPAGELDAWDAELARHGAALIADRAEAAELLRPAFAARAAELGLPGAAELRYRPRSKAGDPEELSRELGERRDGDLQRGFTVHGPHRDDLALLHDGLALRAYGSQGQQRAALLALLFAERDVLADRRERAPLMLLDDVMSELDTAHRELLAELLRGGGQAVVTATEAEQVPGAGAPGTAVVEVAGGQVAPAPARAAA
jgi:DNA replication and repair protein RecF